MPSHQNTHGKVLSWQQPSPLKTGEGVCPTYGRALGRCSPAYQYPWSGGGVGAVYSELCDPARFARSSPEQLAAIPALC